MLKCHDGVISGAISIDHERVVGCAPCWRRDRTHEAPRGDVAPYQRQRCQCYTQTLHSGGKLEVYVVELDVTGSPQVGRASFPKPVCPGRAGAGGMPQSLMVQICHILYRMLAQQRGAAGGQTDVGHQRTGHNTSAFFGPRTHPDVEGVSDIAQLASCGRHPHVNVGVTGLKVGQTRH